MAGITREPGLNSGIPDHDGLDEGTRAAIEATLNKGKPVVAGNLADLQRDGSEKAVDPKEENFKLPPGETKDSVITVAEHDAATGGPNADEGSSKAKK